MIIEIGNNLFWALIEIAVGSFVTAIGISLIHND
jgi:hypothetical protein